MNEGEAAFPGNGVKTGAEKDAASCSPEGGGIKIPESSSRFLPTPFWNCAIFGKLLNFSESQLSSFEKKGIIISTIL